MERLQQTEKIHGTGQSGLTSTLLARTEGKAIYKRSDDCYEVFLIKVSKEAEVFGKTYPDREVYPGNEDFGRTAWCFAKKDKAMRKYNEIKET